MKVLSTILTVYMTVILVTVLVLLFVSQWKIYTKAGKPGWAILVPFYSSIVFLQIVGKPWWWIFLLSFFPVVYIMSPHVTGSDPTSLVVEGQGWWMGMLFLSFLVNLVFSIWIHNLLSLSFGKSSGFTVGLILLPFVFYPLLGLGGATYRGPAGK
jgi:hypothetical protein